MKLQPTCVLLVGLLLITAAPAAARKWTNNTGKFSVEAELVEAKEGIVRLKRPGGKIITVPVSKLSKADRDYLASIAKAKKGPEAPKLTPDELVAAIGSLGGRFQTNEDKTIAGVAFENENAVDFDAALEYVERLPNLRWLAFKSTKVTVTGLKRLNKLTGLRRLFLDVSDAELNHLKGMTQLEDLYIGSAKISDAGLKHLKGLKSLQDLGLSDTKVTDAGLEHLKGLTRLSGLDLDGTNVTGAGFKRPKGLKNLRYLVLGAKATDAGIEHLKGLTDLRYLHLENTMVTDAGLKHLKGLTHLRQLYLEKTKVTDEGVKRLQQALPKCYISR